MYLKKNQRLNFVSHVRGKDLPARLTTFLFTLLRIGQIHQQHTLCNFPPTKLDSLSYLILYCDGSGYY
jgi:hypothetical protein